ncbi:S8 family serine peptidase [bacterium]|nr:S8 family serine peptidase [bacterium]
MRYSRFLILLSLCWASLSMGAVSPLDKLCPTVVSKLSEVSEYSYVSVVVQLTDQAQIRELDNYLFQTKATRAERHKQVIRELRRVAAETQPFVAIKLEELKAQGLVNGYSAYWITNCFVVSGTKSAILRIAEIDEIDYIENNFRPVLIEPVDGRPINPSALDENHGVPTGIRAVGAARVWNELGITGAGRLVGNIDTGVDGNHPALAARWRGLEEPAEECWLDVVGNSTFPYDDPMNGHGTHTMGTICGNSTVSNDSIGVAPGARWIASNGINQSATAQGFTNDILAAFQWMADPDSNELTIDDVPDVVQNSWGVNGDFPGFSDCYPSWNNVIVNCEAAGVVVVFSAGNEGPSSETLRSPATYEIDSVTVFSVGAVDADSDTIPPYEIAGFSSRGPSSCSPGIAIKPEVCAPGVDVYSSIPGTTSQPNSYTRHDGTSMAGPHVAGIVALMREANPNADVREIKSVLMRTAVDMGTAGEDNTYGMGFVDAFAAVTEISANRAIVEGTVTDAVDGVELRDATVRAGESYLRTTDAAGHYRMSLRGDSTWAMSAEAYGYFLTTASVTLSVGDTVTQDFALNRLPFGVLAGRVLAGDSIGVPGATVEFLNVPLSTMTTDANGVFTRSVPADSTYSLRVRFHDAVASRNVVVSLNDTTHVDIYFESARSQAQGPDIYGYYAYDMIDNVLAPEFDWVEITPARGGPGIGGLPAGNDQSMQIIMPFPFWFYGEEFDTLIVNENGWLSTTLSSLGFFQNGAIPGAAGPSGMLAPFWDNLFHVADAEVSWWYDEPNHRVVIEYYRLRLSAASETVVTFQVQIFDRTARPTATGDCEILFLYEEIGVSFQPTVGIENPQETIGLELQYNNDYGSNTWKIVDNTAILFSTSYVGSVTGMIAGHPAPEDYSQVVVSAGTMETFAAASGFYSLNNIRSGLQEIAVTLAGYENLHSAVEILPQQAVTLDFEIWRLDPPRNLNAELNEDHTVSLNWGIPESVGGGLDEFSEYRLYENESFIGSTGETTYLTSALTESGQYVYSVTALYDGGESAASNTDTVEFTTEVNRSQTLPLAFALEPPYPNPFNSSTSIDFALPHSAQMTIRIYDVLGREVETLMNSDYPAGYHRLNWTAGDIAAGLYFIRMTTEDFVQVRKLLLIK